MFLTPFQILGNETKFMWPALRLEYTKIVNQELCLRLELLKLQQHGSWCPTMYYRHYKKVLLHLVLFSFTVGYAIFLKIVIKIHCGMHRKNHFRLFYKYIKSRYVGLAVQMLSLRYVLVVLES